VQADLYRERSAACGRQPGAIVLRRDIYVGDSSSEAQAVLQHALSRGYRGMPAEALIAGSVDEVAEQFRTFGKIGYTDILVRHLTNDQPKVLGPWSGWPRYARRWPEQPGRCWRARSQRCRREDLQCWRFRTSNLREKS